MAYRFPSEEWIHEYQKAINASEDYKKSGATWTAGAVCLVVLANPSIDMEKEIGIWLGLNKGVCEEIRLVTVEEAQKAPFVITGDYSRWKQVVLGELEPIQGMMQGKLKLKGDLPTIVRYVKASQDLVECASKVDTRFADESI
jgi:putative sterol carrier protein